MPEAFFKKTLGTLRPYDAEAEEMLAAIPEGTVIKAKVSRPRSVPHHRLYFGLLKKVYENSPAKDRYPTVEIFRDVVSIGAGHFDWVMLPSGKNFPIAKSVKFSKLDQQEFNTYFDAAVDCICNKLKLVESADLRREFEEMLAA